jgi:hypothetical protein
MSEPMEVVREVLEPGEGVEPEERGGEPGVRRWFRPDPGAAPFRFDGDATNLWYWHFCVRMLPPGVEAEGHCWPNRLTQRKIGPLSQWVHRICRVSRTSRSHPVF